MYLSPPVIVLILVAVFVVLGVLWFRKGRYMWDDHKLSVRDEHYRRDTRGMTAPRGEKQIRISLPNLQVVAHEKAHFIEDLQGDLAELEDKRADNPYRSDYLLEEHNRLRVQIRQARDDFAFTVKTINDYGREIGVTVSQNYKEHLSTPTELESKSAAPTPTTQQRVG